jgi:predicted amidophosphoribosyltransferase
MLKKICSLCGNPFVTKDEYESICSLCRAEEESSGLQSSDYYPEGEEDADYDDFFNEEE